jgi:hypothetical protein
MGKKRHRKRNASRQAGAPSGKGPCAVHEPNRLVAITSSSNDSPAQLAHTTDSPSEEESQANSEADSPTETPLSTNDPLTQLPPTTHSPSETAYYEALVALSGTVLSIVLSFAVAYSIYSKQKQDELAINIQKGLWDLNKSLWDFSASESARGLPVANYMNMLQGESWGDTPGSLFDKDIEVIRQKFDELNGRFKGDSESPASLLEVDLLLNGLLQKMYCEFPSYRALNQANRLVEYHSEFIDANFPACQLKFEKWVQRFIRYHEECLTRFSNLSTIIDRIIVANEASSARLAERLASNSNPPIPASLVQDMLRYSHANANKYPAFLRSFNAVGTKVDQIGRDIKHYKGFRKRAPSPWTFIFMVLAAIPGAVIPLLKLSLAGVPLVGEFANRHMQLLTFLGFSVLLVLSIVFLVPSISASVTIR